MATLKTILRRARTLLWTSLSILVIFAAVLVGVGKLLMPYSEHYQPRLEAWLSLEFGQKVTLESFAGEWNAFGPRLSLRGLRLRPAANGKGEVAIAEAALDLKPLNVLIPGKSLYNFLVIGADFRLVHTPDGQYLLSGLGVGGPGAVGEESVLRNLVGIGELILEDSSLEYVDEKHDIRLNLTHIDARLQLDGNSVAVKLEARLSDEGTGRVYAELDANGLLELAEPRGLDEAHWQVTVRELLLSALQGRLPASPFQPQEGRVNAEFWCDWVADTPLQVAGVVDLRNGLLEHGEQKIVVEHLNTRLAGSFGGKGDWRIDFSELAYDDGTRSWTAPSVALARSLPADIGLWISADYLPLDVPLRLARDVMDIYGTTWPAYLPGAAAGSVSGLELVLDRQLHLKLARGTARQASLSDWGKWPDLAGINGDINLFAGFGSLSLHANQLGIVWPDMFGEPLEFSFPGCELDLDWRQQMQVSLQDCQLLNSDIAVQGDALIVANGGRPAVDINVNVGRGHLAQASPYWPEGFMGKNIVGWLRRGLIDGELINGRLQIHGDLDDWPFRAGEGRFEAVARVEAADLDYVSGWPRAKGIDATARFVGASMAIEGTIREVGGVQVQRATAAIADLKMPLLQVEFEAQSRLDELVGFVIRSPIEKMIDTRLDQFDFSGSANAFGSLHAPLGMTPGELEVDGHVTLLDNDFAYPDSGVSLEEIKGEVRYNKRGVEASGLRSKFKGNDVLLDLMGSSLAEEKFRVDMSGSFTVQDILPGFLLEGYAELDRIKGESDWVVSVVVPAPPPGQVSVVNLDIQSNLIGVTMDLPDPLQKSAGESWPMTLHYPLKGAPGKSASGQGASGVLDLEIDGRMLLRLDIRQPLEGTVGEAAVSRALIKLGDGPIELPPPGFIRIAGDTSRLDLDGWLDVIVDGARDGASLADLDMERCELTATQLRFLDRMFSDVNIVLGVSDDDIKATFSGRDIDGHVVFSPASGATGSLVAEFERLALEKPISDGMDTDANPGELPALHLYARSFRYAGIEMGETRVEAYPNDQGFHFEKVEAESDELSIRANGDWKLHDDGQRSDFNILITAESLGQLMQSMDISSSLEGGQTVLRFNAWWTGSPAAFALSRLNGEIEFSVSGGQISNASAGGGRLLGLLSIQALPRRLALDFRDVFDSGFDFDEAKGTFHMENGMASTDDVELTSSAAKISLTGSTDLVAQQYDQLMIIRPGVGNALPIIGAIAGGPAGAAAGLALQGLLHEQLGNATQVQYTITGSWDEPTIEPVQKAVADG